MLHTLTFIGSIRVNISVECQGNAAVTEDSRIPKADSDIFAFR